MKNVLSFFKLMKLMRNAPMHLAWYKIVQSIMDFATKVQQEGKPMLSKIAVIDMSKEKIIGDFDMVSIWAGVGEANPIERNRHLKAQNTFMKDLLKKCEQSLDSEVDKDIMADINLVLLTFE